MHTDLSELSFHLKENSLASSEPDFNLDLITEYIESHPNLDKHSLSITASGDEGNLQVITSENLVLNDILPKGTKIIYSFGGGEFSKSRDTIWIPKNIEKYGLFGKVGFAHECGHILSPEDNANTEKGKSSYIAFKEAKTDEDKITALVEVQRADMESEIEAWNYGKAVADMLKVDELVYEDLMNYALEHYFLKSLEDIAVSIDLEQVTCKGLEITFIDPKSGQDIKMSVAELKSYIEERYKNNKIIAVDRSAKQIISKYSNMPDK